MLPRKHPDRIRIAFDDHHLVTKAGLILPATLAMRQTEPIPAIRFRRWRAATASTTPMRCAPAGPSAPWAV